MTGNPWIAQHHVRQGNDRVGGTRLRPVSLPAVAARTKTGDSIASRPHRGRHAAGGGSPTARLAPVVEARYGDANAVGRRRMPGSSHQPATPPILAVRHGKRYGQGTKYEVQSTRTNANRAKERIKAAGPRAAQTPRVWVLTFPAVIEPRTSNLEPRNSDPDLRRHGRGPQKARQGSAVLTQCRDKRDHCLTDMRCRRLGLFNVLGRGCRQPHIA